MPRVSPLGIDGTSVTYRDPGADGRPTVAMVRARDERGAYQTKRFKLTSWRRDGSPILPQEAISWAKETRKDFLRGATTAGRASLGVMLEALAVSMEAEPCEPDRVALVRNLAKRMGEAGIDDMKAVTFANRVRNWLQSVDVNWAYDADYKFRRRNAEKLSAESRNKYLGFIQRAVQLAINRRLLAFNPLLADDVRRFKDDNKDLKALFSVDELRTLVSDASRDHEFTSIESLSRDVGSHKGMGRLEAIKLVAQQHGCHWQTVYNRLKHKPKADQWWLPCCMLVYTGARAQEAMHLRWENVKWDAKYIHLKRHADFELKTGEERLIPLEPELANILRPMAKPHGWIIEDDWVRQGGTGKKSQRGKVMRNYLQFLEQYCKRIGMDLGDRTVHSLRHNFITLKIARKDANIDRLRKGVGHKDLKMTERYSAQSQEYEIMVDKWPDSSLWFRRPLPAVAQKAANED